MIALIGENPPRRQHIAANMAYYLGRAVKEFDSPKELLESCSYFSAILLETDCFSLEKGCEVVVMICQYLPSTPLFVISSLSDHSPFTDAGARGFAQFPCNFSELAQSINRYLRAQVTL